jgi:catechol 2,3-dioxygenase-like lactoylglutathione lyase family enzyme
MLLCSAIRWAGHAPGRFGPGHALSFVSHANRHPPPMQHHLRIARPVSDLPRAVRMYQLALSLEEIGRFEDHQGFDGVMLGHRDQAFHFEFTFCRGHPVSPSPSHEDLLVFYVPEPEAWSRRCDLLRQAGFAEVKSFNPYWERLGCTFEDFDRYRVVIQRSAWSHAV